MDQINQYKFLSFFSAIFVTLSMLTIILLYKVISIHGIPISAATLIIPFWYATSDLIAEVYGHIVARRLIWINIVCNFIFIFTIYIFIHLPSPTSELNNTNAYLKLYSDIPRIFFASLIAILSGVFINIYFLSKWKILTNGKHFWVRSIGSSAIGELIFTIIAFFLEFFEKAPLSLIIRLIIISYIVKLIFTPIASTPCAILALFLKEKEGLENRDYNINFNPFKIIER